MKRAPGGDSLDRVRSMFIMVLWEQIDALMLIEQEIKLSQLDFKKA